ncbi:diketogulonate reductase-like aldo/keto reductase [Novosphingobium kunmingense]|uniref:Diketogulonate reductase-like aldo/keto reductase n=1 Tax=Novosphingobium kunmingense TaxID=1211806 RepID=A0A2N0H348_9SPHN|nr:aldo/keto reductase [Novosphingobium kunmingense]PKB13361.1 diketogulonate reductase-like aldo/keto reductase [Novosphingobium kunmingense]
MILEETFTLANGVAIPKLGLGTWRIDDDAVGQVVRNAIGIGYRHIDTAQAYGNERGVGEAVRASGVARDALFVTTKLAAECKSFVEARERIDGSLKTLGLDHIDLMLIHSPQPWAEFREGEHFFEGNLEAWRALEDAHQAGKLRAIGVSNFEAADIDNLIEHGSIAPVVNQILAHVGNTPFDLIDYSRSKGILVEAYSPVAHGAALKNGMLIALADKYGVGIAQLCIRYCLQLGLLPLPKSSSAEHIRENAAIDFAISDEDMAALREAHDRTDYGDAGAFPVFCKKRQVVGADN